MSDHPRDCPHGRQWGKCADCDLAEAQKRIEALEQVRAAAARWCGGCSAQSDAPDCEGCELIAVRPVAGELADLRARNNNLERVAKAAKADDSVLTYGALQVSVQWWHNLHDALDALEALEADDD